MSSLDLGTIDQSMVFHPSELFTISCGTVTLDPAGARFLLIFNEKLGIYQLPKGRKNIGEDFLTAALRETYEETGYRVKPLRLLVRTRATIPRRADRSGGGGGAGQQQKEAGVTGDIANAEPLALCTYPDPQAASEAPVTKLVFYYAAMLADPAAAPDAGAQESHEELRAVWAPASSARDLLRFRADADVVVKAFADAEASGHGCASLQGACGEEVKFPGFVNPTARMRGGCWPFES